MNRALVRQLADFAVGEAGFEQLRRTAAVGREDHRTLGGRERAAEKVGWVAHVQSVCQLVDPGAGLFVGEDPVLGRGDNCAAGVHRLVT